MTVSAWPCTARRIDEPRCGRSSRPRAPKRCEREISLHPRSAHRRRQRRLVAHGRGLSLDAQHDPDGSDRSGRTCVRYAGRSRAAGRGADGAQGAARRGGAPPEPREVVAGVGQRRPPALCHLLFSLPRSRGQGRGERPGGDQVHTHARSDQRRPSAPADGRVLAQLHRRGRRGHAGLRRGAVLRRGLARRELPPFAGRQEMTVVWSILAALGALAFLLGVNSAEAAQIWSVYLANLVFWSGLAVTGPAIAGMMQLTEARWSPSVRRLALTTAGFLPIGFVLMVVLFAGRVTLYPWVTTPIPVKAAWLNTPFFWLRILISTAALIMVAFLFVRALLRDGTPAQSAAEQARRNRLAVILVILWLVTVSLWGFDLVMSLDPKWYSGLFGGYFAVSTLYTGFALLSILAVSANARGLATVPPNAVQDVAKLQFAMSIMWMYFFWSQYRVIWYGNVPVETRFFVSRFFTQPWLTVSWLVMVIGWLIPFLYLLKRLTGRPPQRHTPLVVVALFGLVAIFMERILVIVPSVSSGSGLPLGWREVLITAGFLALFVLSRRWFFSQFRVL